MGRFKSNKNMIKSANSMRITSLFILLGILFVIPLVSAEVTCNSNSLSLTYEKGSIPTDEIPITQCNNDGNSTPISISGSGVSQYINSGSDSGIIGASGTKTLKIKIQSNIPVGVYPVSMSFSDGSSPITISITITEVPQQQGEILVFPLSKILTVQQGQEKTQNILITVPSSYPRTITIQSVDFNPGAETIRFGDLNLGQVPPGQTISIPIVFSGKDAQTGTYSTNLNIFAIDSEGQVNLPTINLQLQVTAGISPVTNNTFATKPSCSLSSTNLALNASYSFTCNNVVANLEVNPLYNNYIEGISVDLSSGTYVYHFKPIKIGNTQFISTFNFKGAPIFSPFESEVRITPIGSTIQGTSLLIDFYQNGNKKSISSIGSGDTTIVVIDEKTNSAVVPKSVILNGANKNSTFELETDKFYELRITAEGYIDKVVNFTINEQPITITLSPNNEFYNSGDLVEVTTDPINSSLLLDGGVVTSPITLSAGDHILKALKEGYLTAEKNITVKSVVTIKSYLPEKIDWKKGENVLVELNNANTTWLVTLMGQQLATGSGSLFNFTLKDYGNYEIRADGAYVDSYELIKKGFFSGWNWWYVIGGVIVVGLITWLVIQNRRQSSEDSIIPFAAYPQHQGGE